VYTSHQTFLCYIYSILERYLSVVSSYCVCVVFVLFFLHLSVCYVSLWLIPHPTVAITNLRIHGMCVCVCVFVKMYGCGLDSCSSWWQVADSCEDGNMWIRTGAGSNVRLSWWHWWPFQFHKQEFIDQMNNHKLLKEDNVPWN